MNWTAIQSIDVVAPSLARPVPSTLLEHLSAACSAIGFDWDVPQADIEVTVKFAASEEADPGETSQATYECAGFSGWGYRRQDVDALQSLLRLLIEREPMRRLLADPKRVLDALRKGRKLSLP
ncbi:hypothetical protein ACI2IX_02640 [Leifsonia aquatica]|uniref:hypothetical protein n=1 Tax=Leifsonia aquatica TaxID=144185 RepID=UPI00384D5A51